MFNQYLTSKQKLTSSHPVPSSSSPYLPCLTDDVLGLADCLAPRLICRQGRRGLRDKVTAALGHDSAAVRLWTQARRWTP